MSGNRPPDVCALCDRAIDLINGTGWLSRHRYLGPGWVHGGGREEIPVHHGCAFVAGCPEDAPVWAMVVACLVGGTS